MINKPIARFLFCRFVFEENVFRTLTKIVIDKYNQFVWFDFFNISYTDMREALQEFCDFIKDASFHTFSILDRRVLKRNLLRELPHSWGFLFPCRVRLRRFFILKRMQGSDCLLRQAIAAIAESVTVEINLSFFLLIQEIHSYAL